MTEAEFKKRTKAAAVQTIKLVEKLPYSRTHDELGKQLIRSAGSVGSNYRSACRARSDAEMLAKLGIAEEEADESHIGLRCL